MTINVYKFIYHVRRAQKLQKPKSKATIDNWESVWLKKTIQNNNFREKDSIINTAIDKLKVG